MEIDARLPAIQTSRASDDSATGQEPSPLPQAASGSEFFISPVLTFDSRSLTVIFQVRDSRSGDVIRQFPPEAVVARYRQDPSARPFVLPESSPNDDPAGDLEVAAALVDIDEARSSPPPRVGPQASGPQASSTPASPGDPVDLVA